MNALCTQAALAAVLLAGMGGCGGGPRKPGPKPGELLFWRITSSEVSLSGCGDGPFFQDIKPLEFDDRSYLVYRVERDGKKATAMDCTSRAAYNCEPSASGLTYDVSGTELLFSSEGKLPLENTTCELTLAQSGILTDRGTTLDMSVGNILGLTSDPECPLVEDHVKKNSPNGLGVQGCVITFTVGAVLD